MVFKVGKKVFSKEYQGDCGLCKFEHCEYVEQQENLDKTIDQEYFHDANHE